MLTLPYDYAHAAYEDIVNNPEVYRITFFALKSTENNIQVETKAFSNKDNADMFSYCGFGRREEILRCNIHAGKCAAIV